MKFSQITEILQEKSNIDVFGGYNHNIKITENEFYDMQNLSSDSFPVLSPRKKRKQFRVDDSHISKKDDEGSLWSLFDTKNHPDTYKVRMGAYIISMPDKTYVNTTDAEDSGQIEVSNEVNGVNIRLCKLDGSLFDIESVSTDPPVNPKNLDYWVDTSHTPHVLKQYSAASAMWTPVATTYVRIKGYGIARGIKQYDSVTIKGVSSVLPDIEGQTSIVMGASDHVGTVDDYIIVTAMCDIGGTIEGMVTIERKMPDMDFVIESNNRLWGCRYGLNAKGDMVNEIYASKQGDFKNWNYFAGTAADSYAVSCGTEGNFTGAITYLGNPLFFKENCMHKVYGTMPSNYQVQTTECRGVEKGAGKSLAIVNEVVYYKSKYGVCTYDGSLPKEISSAFGDIHYTGKDGTDDLRNGACSGSFGNKYFISMMDEKDKKWYLLVYDAQYGMWHKEDELRVVQFTNFNDDLLYIDAKDHLIYCMEGNPYTTKDGTEVEIIPEKKDVEWYAVSGTLGNVGHKYITQMMMRLKMDLGARIMFYIEYDSDGNFEHITTVSGDDRLGSKNVQIRPKRCDHFRIKMVGKGNAKLHTIIQTIEQGSDD